MRNGARKPRSVVLIGDGLALRLGDGQLSGWHQHHAVQLNARLEAPVRLLNRSGDDQAEARGWLLASNHPHWVADDGPMLTLLLEPDGRIGFSAARQLAATPAVAIPERQASWLAQTAARCWAGHWRVEDAAAFVEDAVQTLIPGTAAPSAMDPRIAEVKRILADDPTRAQPIAALAAAVGLSETRLMHLFREHVGLAIRPYRLWLRMQLAVRLLARGHTATEAAHQAGFSDSAHLTRTCRRMFGIVRTALPATEFTV